MHKLFTDLPVSIVINTWSRKLLTLPEHLRSPSVFSWVRVARSLVFRVMLCRSLCLSFCLCSFLPPLCCVSFFDVRLLITPLVSSNFSYGYWLSYLVVSKLNLQQSSTTIQLSPIFSAFSESQKSQRSARALPYKRLTIFRSM